MTARDSRAENLFATWLTAKDGTRFESLVRRHPQWARELRKLHGAWQRYGPLLQRLNQESDLALILAAKDVEQIRRLLAALRACENGDGYGV